MRLTLRTLLAYTDDILDPADHEELSKKIEASDFASELIHRTRDTVRRLRLGAPEVLAGGGDGVLDAVSVCDANAVSEYLDNTLAPEDIADFERMCLEPGNEADMHLAEVASCHHVLAMVLGEPAEIDTEVRKRMYDLPAKLASGQKLRVEPAHVSSPQVATAPVETPPVKQTVRSESEVPDYLREAARAKSRGRRIAMIAASLLVVGGVGYWLNSAEQQSAPAGVASVDLEGADGALEIGGGDTGIDDSGGDTAEPGGEAAPFVPGATAGTEAPAFDPGTSDPGTVVSPPAKDPISEEPIAEAPADEVKKPMPISEDFAGDDNGKAVATLPSDEFGPTDPVTPVDEAVMTKGDATGEGPPLVASAAGTPDKAQKTVDEPTGPVQLGSYLGNNDMLLRHDGESNQWIRLPPRSAILMGDELLSLPTCRTHVVLAGVNAYLSGGTQVMLPREENVIADGEVDLRLDVTYGEVLLNADLDGSQIAFYAGDVQRQFRMAGSASLAVKVRRVFVLGSDNERQMSPVEVVWYLTSGSIDLQEDSGEIQTIEAPVTWKTIGGIDDLPKAMEEFPRWIDREPMTDMQRRAHAEFERELELGAPVRLRLLELSDQDAKGRQREVRTLAAEASVHIGEFEPFVKSLSDKDQRRAWGSHIDTLRQALALSPDAAAGVREAFVNLRGETAGGDLMEMVAGYNQEQIGRTREAVQEGAVAKLLRYLESDNLDYRVLAIHNLDEIMGIKGADSLKGFRPAGPARQRRIAIAKIRESFEANEIPKFLGGAPQ
ncbi:MAG: hypothetical protein GXP26_06105 [Planctomycetes bacterium]|nr:hypothetical protein [Planctomycetota bacterium]